MTDIENREGISFLIDRFYKQVVKDELIAHFFTEVVELDWEKHIPVMINFWESVLLGSGTYRGNPMTKHIELNKQSALKREHFDRWLFLWEKTINEHFAGPIAEEAKRRAKLMADLIHYKLSESERPNFIQ